MSSRTVIAIAAAAATCALSLVSAQSADTPQPLVYEAASVKPNKDGPGESYIRRQPGGRLNAVNFPLRALITFAYQIQGFQLVNAPAWLADERFDIVAKLPGDPPPVPPGSGPDPHMVAMRTLLAERFGLKVHRDTQQLDIYALVKARADGTLGPALKPSSDECERVMKAVVNGAPAPTGPSAPMCGMRQNFGRMQMGGFPLSQFASSLSGQVGRYVVDRTGLTGPYDFVMTFAPEPPRGPLPPGVELPPVDPNAPSLFTAIQEQLGLRLEATKGPVEVLVVDSVDRPISD
jgi:uncharacterized protein (TIGR03435 family)